MVKKIKIGILGAGSFGTALSLVFGRMGHDVLLWSRDEVLSNTINQTLENPEYLKGFPLKGVKATPSLNDTVAHATYLISTIPTQFLRDIVTQIKDVLPQKTIFINASKGIENKTLMLPSQIVSDVLGEKIKERFVVLTGPTFAEEIAQDFPTAAVVASQKLELAEEVQQTLSHGAFRLYADSDVIGCELGGALKNVMAIGTGIIEGLGLGLNTRASFITRCLHQMTMLGVKMGADPLTFSGLSGVGDLILTCTGDLSRNRHVGVELGRGKKLDEILKNMTSVAEGVYTTQAVHDLAAREKVDMPNAEAVYRILYKNLTPQEAVRGLLARELKEEKEGIEE
ncbi:NAD(P)-dependent glycerol-3-phosphate dehydrogenase [bacterium]|nr:NAD(P)-dependent glycerol-3-phosphate dehydrogenase [bacterium]